MKFEVYRSGHSFSEFEDLTKLLKDNNLSYRVEEPKEIGDQIQVGNFTGFSHFLLIKSEDKNIVDELIQENLSYSFEDIPGDFYMMDYSNEELMEVIVFEEEWSQEDVRISKLIHDESYNTICLFKSCFIWVHNWQQD